METPGWPANYRSSAFQIARFRVRKHLHQWYSVSEIFKPQTHDRGRDRTESILQEQILERVQEEPDISTRQLAAEEQVQALEFADFPRRAVVYNGFP